MSKQCALFFFRRAGGERTNRDTISVRISERELLRRAAGPEQQPFLQPREITG